MRYKLLGPSGLRVSELCLGTMSFGDAWGFGADEKEAHRILSAFADAGGNFIDTANKYHEGQSEEIVGSFLGPGRDRFVVATKYTLAMGPGDPNAAGNSRKNLRTSVEASLRRLRTDYLDLLWVHAWDYTTPVEEVMRGLDDLVSAGKVNHVALSDAPAWVAAQASTVAALRGWSPLVALQVEYSLLERTADRELLPMAEAFGLSVCAWAPMGAGILTGKYTRGAAVPTDSRRAPANQARLTERNRRIAEAVDGVADQLGASSAQVALAWARQRDRRIIPITGVRTLDQLEDILGCLEVELPAEHLARLDDVSRIELGFPYELLMGPQGQLVYGDLEPRIELPPAAPIRWRWGRAALLRSGVGRSRRRGACRMLSDANAFSGFAVDDVPRAKEFYGTTLGLEVADAALGVEGADVPSGLEIRLGSGARVLVYPKPGHEPATFTILNFLVDDIERAVDELTARGVRFERYETGPKTDAKGIHRTPEVRPVAWFRDPAGNILSIIEG